MSAPEPSFYVTGGTLRPDAPSYVERPADQELLDLLAAGEFCYLLTSRQMGKSSLMARAARHLQRGGVRTAIVDLTQLGSGGVEGEERWYLGVVKTIHRGLGIPENLKAWWQENDDLGPVQRFVEYFRELALPGTTERLVVFIDEIDSTIKLPFSDDFFAAVRACWNARATEPAFERLSFVLLGVATPDELIASSTGTPFNVGQRVELGDFTPTEAARLAKGLGNDERGTAVLERVLEWTGGQPYLTQELCRQAAENRRDGAEAVDRLVETRYLTERAQREEAHLRHMQARLLAGQTEAILQRLELYRRVLRGKKVADKPTSPGCTALKLAGVMKVAKDGTLETRNRLYRRVFDAGWVRREMPVDRARRVKYGSAAAMLAVVLVWAAALQPRPHVEALKLASEDYGVARSAYRSLRANPFARWRADELLAGFWDRRTLKAELEGDRDRALLAGLQAVRTADSVKRRREAGELAGSFEDLRATIRHGSAVTAVAFSPGGKTVLTGGFDGTARLSNAETGEPIGQPIRHTKMVGAVAFSPDGKTVLTGGDDRMARLWSAETGEPIGQPMRHGGRVVVLTFSSDGKTVLTASEDKAVWLWSAASGEVIGQSIRHDTGSPSGSVGPMAFSPDGKTILITGSDDVTARLWHAETGEPVGQPMRHGASITAVAFSTDGRSIVTGSRDRRVVHWRADTGELLGYLVHQGPDVRSLAFSPDSKTILTGSTDGNALLWRVESGEPINHLMQHGDTVVDSVAFSPDGKTVLTGSDDYPARLWSAKSEETPTQLRQHNGSVFAVAFSPVGGIFLTLSWDNNELRLWRANSGEPIGQPMRHDGRVSAAAFSPDATTVLTGCDDYTARLWSAETGEPLGQSMPHDAEVNSVAFSPDGRIILTGSSDKTARRWRTDSLQPLGLPMQHETQVIVVAFSPDGKTILTGGEHMAHLWRADSGEPIGRPMRHDSNVWAVAFSPDGTRILTWGDEYTVRLWRSDSGELIGQPMDHEEFVFPWAVAFSPDGKTILTGSGDVVCLWSADSGKPLHREPMPHHDPESFGNYVHSVAFSPDGEIALALTDEWLHVHAATEDGLEHRASRFFGNGLSAAYNFPKTCSGCFQIAVIPVPNTLRIDTIHLLEPDAPPLEGDPVALLADWQRRLALRFDDNMDIVPRYRVPSAERPR